MKLEDAYVCLDCDEVFGRLNRDGRGTLGCPKCGSEQVRLVEAWFLPPEVRDIYYGRLLGVKGLRPTCSQ